MKLILKSSNNGRGNSLRSDVRIGKTSISLNPRELSKIGVDTSWYGAFGYDEDMELSLFLSHKKRDGLFKITTSGKKKGMYIPISPINRKTMSPFYGEYDVSNRYNKKGYLILNLKTNKNE